MKIAEELGLRVNPRLRVVALTGAGISIESGVPIFRGKGSMWEIPEARRLAERAGPPWNTKETWEYYEWRRGLVSRCEPNRAHYALAEMEKYFEDFLLITQNVDGLHARAGSRRLLELHGSMWRGRCIECGQVIDLPETPLRALPPLCTCGQALRPDVVQFGEPIDPKILSAAFKACKRAELFLVIGTSAVVYPAAQMPLMAIEGGARAVEINPNPTPLTPFMSLSIRGRAAEALPRLWEELLSSASG
ncbi:MAG: NAD-dependent deacylase [Candidatus Bathyarchaeia archaeon]